MAPTDTTTRSGDNGRCVDPLDPRWFRTLVETLNEGVAVVDPDLKFLYSNSRFGQMVGHSFRDLLGTSLSSITGLASWVELSAQWRKGKAGEQSTCELTLVHSDGSEIIANVSVAPIFDDHERFVASVAVFTDITGRRRVEREKDDAFAVMEQIINTAGGGIRVIDRDFNVVRVNSAFLEVSGLSRDQALTLKCYESFSSPNCHQPSCPLARILGGEERVESEDVKVNQRGDRIPCHAIATPFRQSDGRVTGIVQDVRDVSDLALARQNLNLRERKLEIQHRLLVEKEAALRQVIGQIEGDKRRQQRQIVLNVDRIIIPLLRNAHALADAGVKPHLTLLENSLKDIISPLGDERDERFASLSPREIEICHMIKQGLRSKEIAGILNTAEGTVEQQRKRIRKKLGLRRSNRNLTSFLKSN